MEVFRAGPTAEVNLADPEPAGRITHPSWPRNTSGSPPQRSWRMWLELLCTVCCPRKSQTWVSSQLWTDRWTLAKYHKWTGFFFFSGCVCWRDLLLTRTVRIRDTIVLCNATVTNSWSSPSQLRKATVWVRLRDVLERHVCLIWHLRDVEVCHSLSKHLYRQTVKRWDDYPKYCRAMLWSHTIFWCVFIFNEGYLVWWSVDADDFISLFLTPRYFSGSWQ